MHHLCDIVPHYFHFKLSRLVNRWKLQLLPSAARWFFDRRFWSFFFNICLVNNLQYCCYNLPEANSTGGSWKRIFYSENTSNVFRLFYAAGGIYKRKDHRSFCIYGWGKLKKGNQIVCRDAIKIQKVPFSKCFPSPRKRKVSLFKFLRFEEHFRKPLFSCRISVEGRPDHRYKAALTWTWYSEYYRR